MRPTRDEWGLELAVVTAKRSTCARRSVGCVLVNARGHVIATGYNGVAAGQPHCNQHDPYDDIGYPHACAGALLPSGQGLETCEAIHAEANALLQCRDVYDIETCYVTASPCISCVKLLLNTSCTRIVFLEVYPHPAAADMWARAGRTWEHWSLNEN